MRNRNNTRHGDLLRAALSALDDAIAANPENADLKERRSRLAALLGDETSAKARMREIEAAMREPGIDPKRAKLLLQMYDELMVTRR